MPGIEHNCRFRSQIPSMSGSSAVICGHVLTRLLNILGAGDDWRWGRSEAEKVEDEGGVVLRARL